MPTKKYLVSLLLFIYLTFLPITAHAALYDPKFDMNVDGQVNLNDVIYLINVILGNPNPTINVTPTASVTKTPTPTPTPTKTPTPVASVVATPTPVISMGTTPIPTSSNQQSLGIIITQDEIMKLPTSGTAWNNVLSAAEGSWGTVNLGDLNNDHDVKTLAGALVAVRNNNSAMRGKVVNALEAARNFSVTSGSTRALELSRNIQSYIFAADIIGYRDGVFMNWVSSSIKNTSLTDHSCGSKTEGAVICTAKYSSNNWGGHARGAVTAAAIYLKDATLLNSMVEAQKRFLGLSSTNTTMVFSDTNWHAGSPVAGINVIGAKINGIDMSGVLPEDWRREGEFHWPISDTTSVEAGYKWEGLQGYITTAIMLHRAGKLSFTSGDNAPVRALTILYKIPQPAKSDDTWIPWVVNYFGGSSFPTTPANTGKNFGYTDWLYAK